MKNIKNERITSAEIVNRSQPNRVPGASKHRMQFALIPFVLVVLALVHFHTEAQPIVDSLLFKYTLVKDEDNRIQNEAYLESFFEILFQQKTLNDRKINIIHIGDSHIQGDYLTAVVRRYLQHQFGNAGRGLVVPYAVAGTNGAPGIVTRSNIKWNVKRCVSLDNPMPIGIGGITINTDNPNADLRLYVNDLWMDYSFNRLTVFFQKSNRSFHFSICDTLGNELAAIDSSPASPFDNHAHVSLLQKVTALQLKATKSNDQQVESTIYGLSVGNSENGILYHSIGVNGAKYEHYNAASLFAAQTSVLEPQLFLISLGTNEAISFPYLDRNFPARVDKLINALQSANPNAKFILVTPPGAFRKKVRDNPGVATIRQQIIEYAVENGLAFYDLYKAAGGDDSANAWKESGLLRTDGIHFTKEGYQYQGLLLFHALMKAYNNYVLLRHP